MSLVKKNWPVWVVVAACGLLCSSSAVTAFSQRQAAQQADSKQSEATEQQPLATPVEAAGEFANAVTEEPQAQSQPRQLIPVQTEGIAPSDQRTHKVHLAEDGMLVGQIGVLTTSAGDFIAVSDLSVNFYQSGRLIATTKPGPDGVFQVKIDPGVYSLIASGNDGFSSYSMEVLPQLPEEVQAEDDDGNPIQIETAAVPPADFGILKMLVKSRVSTAQVEPEKFDNVIKQASFRSADGAAPDSTVRFHTVMLNKDGEIAGVAQSLDLNGTSSPAADVDIFFAQEGRLVAQGVTDTNGVFRIKIEPGVYTVVAASSKGFAALSTKVVQYDASQTALIQRPDGTFFVQTYTYMGMSFDLTNPADLQALADLVNSLPGFDPGLGSLTGGGAFPGGLGGPGAGGAGGAAGGGGGLFGALVGAGIGAGIASAIIDSDDDDVQTP